MAVKMRLRRMGQKKAPFYRLVVSEDPSVIKFDEEATKKWLANGAQPTETVGKLLKIAGIQ